MNKNYFIIFLLSLSLNISIYSMQTTTQPHQSTEKQLMPIVKEIVNNALKLYGIDPNTITLVKIPQGSSDAGWANSITKTIAINEEHGLSNVDYLVFTAFHEAAHIKCNHSQVNNNNSLKLYWGTKLSADLGFVSLTVGGLLIGGYKLGLNTLSYPKQILLSIPIVGIQYLVGRLTNKIALTVAEKFSLIKTKQNEHQANVMACEKLLEVDAEVQNSNTGINAINSFLLNSLTTSLNPKGQEKNPTHPPASEEIAVVKQFLQSKGYKVILIAHELQTNNKVGYIQLKDSTPTENKKRVIDALIFKNNKILVLHTLRDIKRIIDLSKKNFTDTVIITKS